jgi:hypothetical protein
MRTILIAAAFSGLAACQPAPAAPAAEPEVTAAAEDTAEPIVEQALAATFVHAADAGTASLLITEDPAEPGFGLDCTPAALTLTGATSQVALGNMAMPYSISVSGASFEAELVPGDDAAPTFAVTAPLTPEVLSALSGATTARIFVNDGYAFVESGIDTGEEFERFATACADLSGIVPAP